MFGNVKRNYLAIAVLLGAVGLVILIVGGVFYIVQMQNTLREQTITNVLEVTEQGGKSFESYIDQGNFMLEDRAENFAKLSSTDTKAIESKLEMYEGGDPSFACINLANGDVYYNSKEKGTLSQEQLDLYRSLPERGVVEPFLSEYNGKRVLGYYCKFKFANGAQGMVMKTIPVNEFADRFSLSFYDGAGFNYIVNSKGDILLRSSSETGNRTFSNVFDVVALDDNSDEDVELFRSSLENKKSGIMNLAFHGDRYDFAFVPLGDAGDWYLISIVPNDVIMEKTNQMLMTTQLFLGVLVIAALVFISFMLVVTLHRRKVKEQEVEVLYREQLFDMLANNADDVFIMLSEDRQRIEYISPNVEQAIGISVEEIKNDGISLLKLIESDAKDVDLAEILDVPLGGTMVVEKDFIHPLTGDHRWFVVKVYHTITQSVERYIIVFSDRTEDRRKEAALSEALQIAKDANESKSAFLSNMSHDIRTPMNAIIGLVTLLQKDSHDPALVEQHTSRIASSSHHLLGLINNVLDMSKIESGKLAPNIEEMNLAEMVDEVATIIRPQAEAKNQTFDIQTRGIEEDQLMGDKLRINQVLINILSNAVKYTPEGGHIAFRVEQIGKATYNIARIRFIVSDDGIGMSPEFQQQIFQPFTREVSTLVNEIQGTGLGMAITKNLVDLMGGTIEVDSELGKGSTFTIELDFMVQDNQDDPEFWQNHGIANVLVVDDDEDFCESMLAAMSGSDLNVQFVMDGKAAINTIQYAHSSGRDFDLVLIDWYMPGMDGLETASRIREVVPSNVPIMIMTSADLTGIHENEQSSIADGFLAKPFFVSNLKEIIRNLNTDHSSDKQSEKPSLSLNGMHFLYAEDNDLNALILADLLEIEGATCHRVSNGLEAVDTFAASSAGDYDAILMDVQMPVMNGYEATRTIRALDHELAKTIPIIALTANAFAEDVRDAVESGMNAHLAKPIDMTKLVEILSSLK